MEPLYQPYSLQPTPQPTQIIQQQIVTQPARTRQFNIPRTQQNIPYHQQATAKNKAEERTTERVSHILKTLPPNTKINVLVDIGAGNAEITDKIAKTLGVAFPYAMDVYPASEFVKPSLNSTVKYIQIPSSENLPFPANSVDMVTAFMSIHHIKNTTKLFSEICRVLKPNGFFFFREHDVTNDERKIYLDQIHEKYEKNPHEHSINPTYYWSRQNLFNFLTQHGFQKIGDSDYNAQQNPQAIYHSMYRNVDCKLKILSVFISDKSEDSAYVKNSFVSVQPSTNFVATWEEANVIWKPTPSGIDPATLPKLEYLNNLLTSSTTLTEKSSLLQTGKILFGDNFFTLTPYIIEYKPGIQLPVFSEPSENRDVFITKPVAGFSGQNIQLFNDRNTMIRSLSHGRRTIIQKYIENPLLINGHKFDVRMYVLITGNKILMYLDGYARVSPELYSINNLDIRQYLTNISLNKDVMVLSLDDIPVAREIIYSFIKQLRPLFQYALRVENEYKLKNNVKFETFELFGIDILFDVTGKPWLLEINKNPGALTNTPHIVPDVLEEVFFNQNISRFVDITEQKELFPYKKEFLNAEELWNNAINLDLAQVQLINIPQNSKGWFSIPRGFKWEFQGKPVAIVVSSMAYDKVDKLVDYFSEEIRMQAHRKECVSPYDFYETNYSDVITKAQELQRLDTNNLPYRHWLREAIYMLIPECTAFKISVTKAFLKYIGSKVVLDPSAGWGDRLLGAAAAGVTVYHGVDPNPLLRDSYNQMLNFIQQHGVRQNYFVLTDDFLQANLGGNFYDTVFTSPPFFDYEIYVEDAKQSITGRTTLQEWTTGFLYPYIYKAWSVLAQGGFLCLYISDTRSGKYVENMYKYINQNLRGTYMGIIAVADEKLGHAFPLWIWRK
jgi:ubiquinone/menaquinone biosynthesis C-methylase UbiE